MSEAEPSIPDVPGFADLPPAAQGDLAATGLGADWMASAGDELRLTVLNLYARLDAIGLWHHVRREDRPKKGCLNFRCRDADALEAALGGRGFTGPTVNRKGIREMRERRARGALHLKHFPDEPADRLQIHVDPYGLLTSRWWWLFPPIPLALLLFHAVDDEGYQDVARVREIVLRQLPDAAPLLRR